MERSAPEFELIEGHAAYAVRAAEMTAGARMELALLSQELDRRIYGTETFFEAVKTFVLQHSHARLRVLVGYPQRAISGASRLVEFGRTMSTFIEFRELLPERKAVIHEEYLIADGRLLVVHEAPENLEAKYYGASPHLARLKLKDFDLLWSESTTAQELRNLRL